MRIIGIDPSGSFKEGKGTTGICILDNGLPVRYIYVCAEDHATRIEYWQAVIEAIETHVTDEMPTYLSLEDYVLYASSAKAQTNSEMETSKLIGAIEVWAANKGLKLYTRNAAQVKKRWSNEILEHKHFIVMKRGRPYEPTGTPINKHCIDALRHAVHCYYFEVDK